VRLAALEAARERKTPVTIRSDDGTITAQLDVATDEAIAGARGGAPRRHRPRAPHQRAGLHGTDVVNAECRFLGDLTDMTIGCAVGALACCALSDGNRVSN